MLLKCWHGCEIEVVVAALGLDLSDLFPQRLKSGQGGQPIKRRRLLRADQALDLLDAEMVLVVVCAMDIARGELLDANTKQRLLQAAARVSTLRDEVRA